MLFPQGSLTEKSKAKPEIWSRSIGRSPA